MPPRERVAGETTMAVPVSLRLSRVVFCFLRVLCALCGFPSPCPPWFAFSGLLTPEISPAREDFHAATGASCRRGPNRHRCLVAALPRCVARSSRGAGSFCGAGFLACGRFSSRPGRPLSTALNPSASDPRWSKPPGLPRRQPCAGGWQRSLSQSNPVGHASRPAGDVPAGLGALHAPPGSKRPQPAPRRRSSQGWLFTEQFFQEVDSC
jgi:hypothetical protein